MDTVPAAVPNRNALASNSVLSGTAAVVEPDGDESPKDAADRRRVITWVLVTVAILLIAGGIVAGLLLNRSDDTKRAAASSPSTIVAPTTISTSTSITTSTALSSNPADVLAPATVASRVGVCSQQLQFGADGNVGPVLCADGRVNGLAWLSLASSAPRVLGAGPLASPDSVSAAMCADQQNSTLPITQSAYEIAKAYYGWQFGVDPTCDVTATTAPVGPGDVSALPPGLHCRDLFAQGYSYSAAVEYWRLHGQTNEMDVDHNGIPCETVYSSSDVVAYWGFDPHGGG
jgi:hypothetical protein